MTPNGQEVAPQFQEQQPMFPANRPDVQPSAPQRPTIITPMGASQLVDREILDMVMGRYEVSKQWRRTRRLIWDKAWQHMKALYDKANKSSWQSTTFMPLTSKVVEVVFSNLFSAVLGVEVPVELQTRRADLDPLIRSHNELIQADYDKSGSKVAIADFLRNLCVTGTGVGEVGYVKQVETVMMKQRQQPSPIDGMLKSLGVNTGEQFIPKQMLVKDYAIITNKDIYDIYPEPRKPDFSKDAWVIEKCKITNRELVMGSRDQDPYYRFDNVSDALLEGSGMARTDLDPEIQNRRFALLDYNYYSHYLDPDREHELYKFYGMIPLWYLQPETRNDKERQYDAIPGCIYVVDGQYVVWKRISPWRDAEPPYFKGNYIKIPGPEGFYGIGVAELVMGLQIEFNEIRNSRMDNINLSMNKIVAVIKDMVPPGEWKRLVSEPGAVWLFKGVDDVRKAIQQIEFGNVTQDSWEASAEVAKEAEEVTAANKITMAAGGSSQDAGGSTYRGQMLNVQQANGRWMLYARMLEWQGILPAMKKFYQRIYQFKSYQDAQEILGPDRSQTFQFLSPEDLEKVARLVPLGVMTLENKGVKLAQMNQFAMLWMQQPWFKSLEFARKMAVEMGNPEPDSILFSDEEMQQYNQFKQMMFNEMPGMPNGPQGPQMGAGGPPQGLVGPNGQPLPPQGPQSGNRANVPGGAPVSGNVPGPLYGMPRPALQARGPGASPMDLHGAPMS